MARMTLRSPCVPDTSQILTSGVNPKNTKHVYVLCVNMSSNVFLNKPMFKPTQNTLKTHCKACVHVIHVQSLEFCGGWQGCRSIVQEVGYNDFQNQIDCSLILCATNKRRQTISRLTIAFKTERHNKTVYIFFPNSTVTPKKG